MNESNMIRWLRSLPAAAATLSFGRYVPVCDPWTYDEERTELFRQLVEGASMWRADLDEPIPYELTGESR